MRESNKKSFFARAKVLGLSGFLMLSALLVFNSASAYAIAATTPITHVSSGRIMDSIESSAAYPSISDDGRYVAYGSAAGNLVANDNNNVSDIFIFDSQTNTVRSVSTDSAGNLATGSDSNGSYGADISGNGRYVAFVSSATNLVPGDTNGVRDIFVKDLQTNSTTRVSTDASGAQATGGASFYPVLSSDGRYVAFYSLATNLVAGDTNGARDIFVKDLQTGVVTRASTSSAGVQSNNSSYYPVITDDGRYAAFYSDATNLVTGDTNNAGDIFVKDLQTNTTTRVSTDSSGAQANQVYSSIIRPAISSDGRYVAFSSDATNLVTGDTNNTRDIFVKDLQTNTTTRVSTDSSGAQANRYSTYLSMNSDGSKVFFDSAATNLVAGDTNGVTDIFMKDLQTNTTTRVSTDSSGAQASADSSQPSTSADGRFVTFLSTADNLTGSQNNNIDNVYKKDLQTGSITLASDAIAMARAGSGMQPAIAGNGSKVLFYSYDSTLVAEANNTAEGGDAYVYNVVDGSVSLASSNAAGSDSNGYTEDYSAISQDGRYAAFWSTADNLTANCGVNNDYHAYVKDLQTGAITCVSTNSAGVEGDQGGYPGGVSFSDDNRYMVLSSSSTNLVAGDTNNRSDIFVKDLQTGSITRVSTDASGNQATGGHSEFPSISSNGRYVAFMSIATNLVPGDTNGAWDVFVKDLQTGTISRVNTSAAGDQANDNTDWDHPYISDDGRYAVFTSYATNLVPGDTNGVTDIFMKDLQTGAVTRLNTDTDGNQTNGETTGGLLSDDGRFITFYSSATNLVPGDTNGVRDVFVKDIATGRIARVSTNAAGEQANGTSGNQVSPQIMSTDGRYLAFSSLASNLVANDTNNDYDVFLRANPFVTFTANDDFSNNPIMSSAGGRTASVLINDTINGTQVTAANYNISIIDNGGVSAVSINPDGTLTIPANTAAGTYNITYQLCEIAVPTYCVTGIATVKVAASGAVTSTPTNSAPLANTGLNQRLAALVAVVLVMIPALSTPFLRHRNRSRKYTGQISR